MAYEYIERSKEMIQGIDPQVLGDRRIKEGALLWEDIAENTLYALGSVTVGSEEMPLALKKPGRQAQRNGKPDLLQAEMPVASVIEARAAEVAPLLPAFMGRVTIRGEVVAMITEDPTYNREKPTSPIAVTDGVQAKLEAGFRSADTENLDDYFGNGRVEISMAQRVGGEERLFGLSPNPLRPKGYSKTGFSGHVQAVEAALPDLTIDIPADSPLARSIVGYE